MGENGEIGNFQLHLQSISCEISDVKLSLQSVLNKLECHISLFVYFKEKLSILDAYREDVHMFENFLDDLKEEVLNTDKKVSLLEEKTNYFSSLLEQNEGASNQFFKLKTEQLDADEESEGDISRNEMNVEDDGINSDSLGEEMLQNAVPSIEISKNRFEKILRQKHIAFLGKKELNNSESLSQNTCSAPIRSGSKLRFRQSNFIRFKCNLCFKVFTKKQNFNKHQENHEKEFPFMCNICGLRVKDEVILYDHKEKNHKISETEYSSEFQCYICNKLCATLSNLLRHIKRNHTQYYECPICGRNFRDISVLDSHYSLHSEDTDVKCLLCKYKFIKESQLQKHVSQKHTNGDYQEACKINEIDSIDQKDRISMHEENCDTLQLSVYSDMDISNDTSADQLRNDNVSSVPTNYQCKKCSNYYPNLNNLVMHILERYSMFYFLKHQCEICLKIFEEAKALREHKKLEHEYDYPHHCTLCGKVFSVESDLKIHIKSEHEHSKDKECEAVSENLKSFKCNLCDKKYEIINSLIRHKRVHSEEIFECLICKKIYKDTGELRKHFYGHILKSMTCPYCDQVFDDRNQLAAHMVKKHNFEIPLYFLKKYGLKTSSGDEKNPSPSGLKKMKEEKTDTSKIWKLTCQICMESFLSRGCYFEHRKTHTASELSFLSPKNKSDVSLDFDKLTNEDGSVAFYNCKICSKSFSVKTYIERHLLTHTGDRPYRCNSCGKCYNDSSHLRRHISSSHPGADGNLSCRTCKEQFDTIEALTEHKQTHVGEKPHQCIACGRCFSHKNNLRSHVCPAKIGKEKLFTCEICSNKYHTNFQLKVHIRKVHRKSKSEVCEYCGDTFSQKASLDRHRYIHTGGKPLTHQCSVCNKWFKDSRYLKQHMNIHTGKRFFCQVCGNSFAYVRGLQRHMKETCSKINDNSIIK